MTYRVVTGALGTLFLGAAILIPILSNDPAGFSQLFASLAIGGLGLEALVSALKNRDSLLARIGPLP